MARVAAKIARLDRALGDRAQLHAHRAGRQGQLGQHRHGQAARGQRDADRRAVGPVANVGLEAAQLATGAAGHLVPAHPRLPGGPGLPGERAQRHSPGVRPRQRVAPGQHEIHRVAEQLVPLDARRDLHRLVAPLVAEHEVDVTQRQGRQRLLGLGLDQLAAQPRGLAREPLHRRQGEPQRDGLEPGYASAAGDDALRRREVGLGERHTLEQSVRMANQDEPGVGEAHAPAGALEQRNAGLALEHRELLRHRRGRELQGVGDRGDGPALVQLAEQAQSAELQHGEAILMNGAQKSESMLKIPFDTMDPCAPPAHSSAWPPPAASAPWASWASSRTATGPLSGPCSPPASRLAALLFWVLMLAGRATSELRDLSRRDLLTALALGALGYAAQAGAYFAALARMEAGPLSLLVYTYPAIVAVAGVLLGRERLDARRLAALVLASSWARARAGQRRHGAARPARRRARARRGGRVQRLHPRQREHRRADGAARVLDARVQRRGGHAHRRRGSARRAASAGPDCRRLGMADLPRARLDGRAR